MRVTNFPDFNTYRYLQYLQILCRYCADTGKIPTWNSDKIPTDKSVGIQIPTSGICKYMHVSVVILHYVCTIWLSVQYEINTYVRHQQVYACICRYLYYDCTMCSILHYVLAVCLRKDSGSPSEAHSHRFGFIPIHFSSGKGRVVIGPDHGPHVDVEQGTYTTGSGDGRYMHFVPIWPWQWWAECTSSECT